MMVVAGGQHVALADQTGAALSPQGLSFQAVDFTSLAFAPGGPTFRFPPPPNATVVHVYVTGIH